MNLTILCAATAAALLSSVALAQTQSGSAIGSNTGTSSSVNVQPGSIPSTGTSADTAGAASTTAPRSPETSVGTGGAVSGAASTGTSSGRCDTLIGEERIKCLKEQASTGTTGPGSTGMGSGTAK
jgi:hypothetical protein